MKLGYIYNVTARGFGSKEVKVNGDGLKSIVDDERTLWFEYALNGEGVAIKFTKNSLVVIVYRIIGGDRSDNNISTWVEVPADVKIEGGQILEVISEVRKLNLLGTSEVSERNFIDNPILNKDYDKKTYSPTVKPSEGNKLGYRTGRSDWSLNEVLDRPFQDYYRDFKYIFLFKDQPSKVDGLIDLSSKEVKEMLTVLPMSEMSIRDKFGNHDISIELDGKPFKKVIHREKNSHLSLVAKRVGFLPISFNGVAIDDESEADYSFPAPIQWKKVLSEMKLEIKDSITGKNISTARCEIKNKEFDKANNSLPENLLNSVEIYIEAAGYKPETKKMDFTSSSLEPIYLERPIVEAKYTCQTHDNRTLDITIKGIGAKDSNPLDGYESKGNKLVYVGGPRETNEKNGSNGISNPSPKNSFHWVSFFIGVACSILLGACVWVGMSAWSYYDSKNEKSVESSTSAQDGKDDYTSQNDEVIENALAYLDNKEGVWNRDSLNKYNLTELFDGLNSYDFTKIMERSDLEKSKNFRKLKEAIDANKSKNINGKYCKNGDYSITIDKYISKLNKSQADEIQGNNENPEETVETTVVPNQPKTGKKLNEQDNGGPSSSSSIHSNKSSGRGEVDKGK